jgi:hypothetical protein
MLKTALRIATKQGGELLVFRALVSLCALYMAMAHSPLVPNHDDARHYFQDLKNATQAFVGQDTKLQTVLREQRQQQEQQAPDSILAVGRENVGDGEGREGAGNAGNGMHSSNSPLALSCLQTAMELLEEFDQISFVSFSSSQAVRNSHDASDPGFRHVL